MSFGNLRVQGWIKSRFFSFASVLNSIIKKYRVWNSEITPKSCGFNSYRDMFICRPRLQFSGCYISKTSYVRPGENSFQDTNYQVNADYNFNFNFCSKIPIRSFIYFPSALAYGELFSLFALLSWSHCRDVNNCRHAKLSSWETVEEKGSILLSRLLFTSW